MGAARRALRRLGRACAAGCALAAPASALTQTPVDYDARYAAVCAACHGATGVSQQAAVPSLAGQHSFYAATQLFLFRDGRRGESPMTALAQGMSDADLRGFSDFIGRLPAAPPHKPATPDAKRSDRGRQLATRLHCLQCHGAQAEGGRQVPRLAGQREDYLLLALQGFRAGSRVGYTPAMSEALAGVTAQELSDLAHYLAHHLAHSLAHNSAQPHSE
jgi:cytochrome c553